MAGYHCLMPTASLAKLELILFLEIFYHDTSVLFKTFGTAHVLNYFKQKDEKNDKVVRKCVNYRDIMNLFQDKCVSL